MSKSIYKKLSGNINYFTCGCCFSGDRNPKCKRVKKRLRQQGKKVIRDELSKKS